MKESPEKDFSQNILPSNVPISNPLQLRGRERESVHTVISSLRLIQPCSQNPLSLLWLETNRTDGSWVRLGSNASAYLRVDALHSGT